MKYNSVEIRQAMGCGWEPRIEGARPWMHEGYTDEPPTTCIGYTAKLPEVAEISRARLAAKNNMLRDFCAGKQATENLIRGIEILETSSNEASCWRPEKSR